MERQEIEIEVFPDGHVEYRIKGIKGSACESISALLEQLGRVEASERTAEYYDQEPDAVVRVGSGDE